jgi:hypothetical protein
MGAESHVVGRRSYFGWRASGWPLGIALALALGACGEKFSPAADNGGTGNGGSGDAPGTGGNSGSSGSNGSGGSGGDGGTLGSSGGASDSGPPDSNPGDGGQDVPVQPPVPQQGLVLWLRADAGISRDGGSVSQWSDQSSAGNHAIQPALALRPRLASAAIAGQPAVEFDGVDDFLVLPNGFADFTRGISIFAVVLQHSSDRCSAVVQLSNGSEIDDITLGQFSGQVLYEIDDDYFSGEAFPSGAAQLFAVVHGTDGAFVLRRNGRPSSEGMAGLPGEIERKQNFVANDLYDGCGTFPGLVAEVLIYARAVATDELFTIERYLRDRSGIR